jgi:RNA polymerase sigma-70 factor (ECF subfamily)
MKNASLRKEAVDDPGAGGFDAQLVAQRSVLYARALFLERVPAAAEDLVQATLERALRHADRFVMGTNLLAWLTRIMRNLFADNLRHRGCENRAAPPAPEAAGPVQERDDPLDLLNGNDVKEATAELLEIYRRPFEMVYFENRSLREVARELSIAPSTAGTRIFRARRMLRRLLLRRWEAMRQSNQRRAACGSGERTRAVV